MRYIFAILLLLPLLALAQETDPVQQGRVQALEAQRNRNANDAVEINGQLAGALAEIERLKKVAAQCKPEAKKE